MRMQVEINKNFYLGLSFGKVKGGTDLFYFLYEETKFGEAFYRVRDMTGTDYLNPKTEEEENVYL